MVLCSSGVSSVTHLHQNVLTFRTCLSSLVVRRLPQECKQGFEPRFPHGSLAGPRFTGDRSIVILVATRQAPSSRGSVLGLVGPVSVYCNWVGQQV